MKGETTAYCILLFNTNEWIQHLFEFFNFKEKLIPTANVYKVGKYSNETRQLLSICNWFTHLDVTLGELTFRSTSFRP